MATAGGLLFIATASDRKFRAYDQDSGRVLWEKDLPAGAEGVPAVYEIGGREYIALCAGKVKAIRRFELMVGNLRPRRSAHISFSLCRPNSTAITFAIVGGQDAWYD